MPQSHDYTVPVYELKLVRIKDFPAERPQLCNCQDIAEFIFPYLKDKVNEELVAIFLDVNERVIGIQTIHIGTPFNSNSFIPSILTPMLLSGAVKLAIAHNHPMGDASEEVSEPDIDATLQLLMTCQKIGIAFLDHIIVDDTGRYQGILDFIRGKANADGFVLDQGHGS